MTSVALQHPTAAVSKAGAGAVDAGAGPIPVGARAAEPPEPDIGVGQMADELLGLAGGLGFFTVAFLFPIPGFIAALACVVLAGILVAIPLLAAGIVAAVVAAPVWLVARLIRAVRARPG